jgi:hypothetical protein
MDAPTAKAARLKGLIDRLQNSVTRNEMLESFSGLLKFLKDQKKTNTHEWALLKASAVKLQADLKSKNATEIETLKTRLLTEVDRALSEQSNGMKFIYDKVAKLKNTPGSQGIPGPKGDTVIGPPGPAGSPDAPEQVRDKLETLRDDARLDASAIKNLPEVIKQSTPASSGISRGIQLYVGGRKKGLAQYINLIAGSGITLTYANANGRNDITVSASSQPLSILVATGAVDDSNKVFTFASTPSLVVVNGAPYRHGHGVTISSLTATLDNPVGTGGDIYAIG